MKLKELLVGYGWTSTYKVNTGVNHKGNLQFTLLQAFKCIDGEVSFLHSMNCKEVSFTSLQGTIKQFIDTHGEDFELI